MVSGKIKTYFLGIVSLLVVAVSLLPFASAQAATSFDNPKAEWIDRGHIRVFEPWRSNRGIIYTDVNPLDGTNHYVNLDQSELCRSSLSTPMNDDEQDFKGSPAAGKLYAVVRTQATVDNAAQCEVRYDKDGGHDPGELVGTSVEPLGPPGDLPAPNINNSAIGAPRDSATKRNGGNISLTHVDSGIIIFHRLSDTQLSHVRDETFTQDSVEKDTYLESGNHACRDSMIIKGTASINGKQVEKGTYRERSGSGEPCGVDRSFVTYVLPIDDPDAADIAAADDDGSADGTAEEDKASCEASGFSLSWILCPIINGLAEATEAIFDNFIKPFLQVSPVEVNDTSSPIYQVWSSFRVLANIVLVIALLVVVLGQSVGGGLVDAYTAKKVLPRLFAAAILINLSIYIVAFMVDLTNILGEGVGSLITAPFFDGDFLTIKPNFLTQVGGLGAFVGASWAAFAVPGFLGFLWVFVLMPALIAMIGVFVTLILRQGLILFLIISSPIAFALYCLPNTEKYFKKWWDLFFKTLMVYPIIVLLFAVSQILAVTISAANGTSGPRATLGQIAAFVIMFIPLFLIPFAFKMAGGAVSSVFGAISGAGKKAGGFIKGDARDPNSLQSRAKRRLDSDIVNKRAGLQNRTSSGNYFTRKLGAKVGGGAGIYAKQARYNEEAGGVVKKTGEYGNDQYIKGATIPKAALRDWSNATDPNHNRYRETRDAAGNITSREWQSADGTWLNRQQIEEGHKYYATSNDRQTAFSYVLGKAEALGPENHERVLDDYINYSNEEKVDPGNATGGWQGIAIPYKGVRADLRRIKIDGKDGAGKLKRGSIDNHGLNTEFSNYLPQQMVQETAGTFDALYSSIVDSVKPVANGSVNPNDAPNPGEATYQERYDKAISAYRNLDKYVGDDRQSGAQMTPAQIAAAQAQAAAAAGGPAVAGSTGAGGANVAGYSSAQAAAHRNQAAAQGARDKIKAELTKLGVKV